MAILLFVSVKMSRSGLKWCEKYLLFYCCFLFSHPSSSQIYQLGWNSNKSAVNVTNKRFCRVTLILGTTQRPATLYLDLSLLILPRYIFLFQSRAHCKCYQLFDICNIWIAYINWVLYDTIFFLSNLKECHQFSSLVISYWMFFFFFYTFAIQKFHSGDLMNCEHTFDKMGRTAQVLYSMLCVDFIFLIKRLLLLFFLYLNYSLNFIFLFRWILYVENA